MKKTSKINNQAIDSSELIIAMDELEKENGIKKEVLLEAIETALVTAYKRNFDSAENVKITMDRETGEIHVYAEKDVVEKNSFFYPSFPRVFKNFEIICKAAEYLEKGGINNFKIYLTIDGSENLYSKEIVERYKKLKTVKFIGLLSREKVYEYYSKVECLIFPSKLETWGLPITEFKEFNKPMIVANLEYAYETVGDYEKVFFFNPTDAENLKNKIKLVLEKDNKYDRNIKYIKKAEIISWNKLFDILLEEK